MRGSRLVSGLRHHSSAQKKHDAQRRRSRLIQSLVGPLSTIQQRDSNSLDNIKNSGNDHHNHLPNIRQPPKTNEPIIIKNKIYIIEEKYPGKPQFKNCQLLNPDEIFIGGIDESRITTTDASKHTTRKSAAENQQFEMQQQNQVLDNKRMSHIVQSAIRVPATTNSSTNMTLEQRNDSILIRENSRDNSNEQRSTSTKINQTSDSNEDSGSGSREPKRVKVR